MEKWRCGWRLPPSGRPAACSAASGGRRSRARRTPRSPPRSCQGEGAEMRQTETFLRVSVSILFWSSCVSQHPSSPNSLPPTPPSHPLCLASTAKKIKMQMLLSAAPGVRGSLDTRCPSSCHGDPGKIQGRRSRRNALGITTTLPPVTLCYETRRIPAGWGGGDRPFQHPLARTMLAKPRATDDGSHAGWWGG